MNIDGVDVDNGTAGVVQRRTSTNRYLGSCIAAKKTKTILSFQQIVIKLRCIIDHCFMELLLLLTFNKTVAQLLNYLFIAFLLKRNSYKLQLKVK